MDRNLAALAVVAALLVSGVALFALQPRAAEAPQFRLEVAGGNATIDLAAARGKVVVLDLMAVECATCKTLTSDVLVPFWHETRNRTDVLLWSVDVWAALPGQLGEGEDDLVALQAREGSGWPHALDDGSVYRDYKALALPELYVIDPQGRIAFHASAAGPFDAGSMQARLREAVEAALVGRGTAAGIPQTGIVGLAAAAGAAAVLAPCSIGLLAAYFGLLVREERTRPGPLGAAAQCVVGVVAVYLAMLLLLLPFGDALRPAIPWMGVAMGVVFVALGILMLAGFDWGRLTGPLVRRLHASPDRARSSWAFGAAYGLASFGCTGPIFLPLLFTAFLDGPAAGMLAFAGYVAGAALLLAFVALVASLGGPRLHKALRHSRWVTAGVAVVWVAAGLYVMGYALRWW